MCSPLVKLDSEMDITPKLLWYPVMNGDKTCGDVLVTAELILRHKVLTEFSLIHFFSEWPIKALVNNFRHCLLEPKGGIDFSVFVSQDGSNLPILPSQRAPNLYMVPQGIRPVVQLTAIEVCCLLFFIGQIKWMWPPNWNLLYRNGTLLCLLLLSLTSFRICPQNRNIHGK